MPDENSTPVWTAQTPQDNQAITNQAWDDFVLDFWESEAKRKIENTEAEHNLGGIEKEPEEEMVSTDIDLNDINLFWEEDKQEDVQQDDIKIEDEKEVKWVENDDFNISLDDNLSQEKKEDENITEQNFSLEPSEIKEDEKNNNNEESEWFEDDVKQENIESEEISDLDYLDEEEIGSDVPIITEQENNLEDKENDKKDDFDGWSLQDDNESETNNFDNDLKDDENDNIEGEEQADYYGDNARINDENTESSDEPIAEDNQDTPLLSDEFHEDEGNMLLDEWEDNENGSSLSDESDDDDENKFLDEWEDDKELEDEDYIENTQKEDSNDHNNETESLDDENEFSYDFQEDTSDDSENKPEIENENDINLWDNKTELEENSVGINFDNTKNEENTGNEELVSQPEIWDLLWSSTIDSSEESKDDIETKDLEFNSETNSKADISISTVDVDDKDNNQNENTNLMNDSDKEEQNFTLDYQEKKVQDNSDNTISEISNETAEWKKEEQVQEKSEIIPENKIDETNLANLVNNAVITNISTENSDEKVLNSEPKNTNSLQETSDWVQWQQIKSTLSLDQILDSELTNNPQFTDSSKAVPTNVSENWGGFGNKRMIWIIACVWLFVLAWIVVVLAFSSKDNKQNTGEGTGTQIIEEYGIDPTHQAPAQPEEEFTWQSTTAPHAGNPTVQQDFPEAESEDEPEDEWGTTTEEQDTWEPAPYTCEWDECSEEPVIIKEEDNKLDVESIEPAISSFKLQAEGYYSIWDERQDKKLIRYAAQAISLCESYQEQINNWEWIDEESFSSFKSKVKTIISKMEEYLGWDNDVQTFTKSNFDEEYDFPWKDEHKQYIYEINS